jgi:plasmid stabilization system protein ParE
MNVRALPAAKTEAATAARCYEAQRAGLGDEFLDELLAAEASIQASPRAFIPIPVPGANREFRRYVVKRFPYQIIYEVTAAEVIIIAVAHTKRRPFYSKGRIP